MRIEYSEHALHSLEKMDNSLRKLFLKHVKKLSKNPVKRHLKFGLPFFVEKTSKQARIVYYFEKNTLYILRCFKTHKEYEKWYRSFR